MGTADEGCCLSAFAAAGYAARRRSNSRVTDLPGIGLLAEATALDEANLA